MVEWIERSSGKVAGLRIHGKLTPEDYDRFLPKLEAIIEQYGALRCLIVVENLEGIELGALWKDLKFDVKHFRDFDRVAFVGPEMLGKSLAGMSDKMFKGEARYFPSAQEEAAWRWVESP